MLFDTHCHIYDEAYSGDTTSVIERAKENNVKLLMLPGTNLIDSRIVDELSKTYDCIYAEVGVHPSEIYDLDLNSALKELKELAINNNKIKAIGEIGLDYFWHKEEAQQALQREWFIAQIELANELHLPIVVHSRDAAKDTLDILKEHKPQYGCVYHCFSYSKEILMEILKMGFYIGLDGPVTYKNAVNPKEIATIVPLDRLMVETDSPYLTPTPYRGKRNEPSYINNIVLEIACLKNKTYQEIEDATFNNGLKFFGIDYE